MKVTSGSERRDGLRRFLEHPLVYEGFQRAVGKNRLRRRFVEEFVRPRPGDRLLDFGCGPGDLVPYVPEVDFAGFDISTAYIASARSRFGERARFYDDLDELRDREAPFDIAVCIGVLHHIDDDTTLRSLRVIRELLSDRGRFVVTEPHLHDGQHWIARELIRRDPGRHVRPEHGYQQLLAAVFPTVEVRRDESLLRVPYSWSIFTCSE